MKPERGPPIVLCTVERGDVRVRHRARVQPRRDEPGEVRHVDPEQRADLVGDLAEPLEVQLARVRRPAGDEHLRLDLERLLAHDIHVDPRRLGVDAVGVRLVELAREVQLHAVREVAAVGQLETQDAVARFRDRGQHGGVGARPRVGLHVGELRPEQALGALDREGLDDVDELAAAVVAATGVALGVLVGEHRALRFEHGARNEVLARDHLEGVALAGELLLECGGDLGVDLGERGVEGVGHGALLFYGWRDSVRPRRATVSL